MAAYATVPKSHFKQKENFRMSKEFHRPRIRRGKQLPADRHGLPELP